MKTAQFDRLVQFTTHRMCGGRGRAHRFSAWRQRPVFGTYGLARKLGHYFLDEKFVRFIRHRNDNVISHSELFDP